MKIIDMVNGKFSGVAPPPQKSANVGFDTFFAEAGRNLGNVDETSNQGRSQDDAQRSRRSEETPRRTDAPTRRRETPQPNDDMDATAGTAVVQEQQTTDQPAENSETEVDEAQVVEKVAEVMQVPVEVVAEWLEEAELVPQDLVEPKAVVKMLQCALDAEKPAELLTDEKFPENYKAINEAMAEVVKAAADAPKAKVQINKETLAVLAEELEDVEVTVEDGEVVVTQTSTRNDTDTRQQSTTAHSEETDETAEIAAAAEEADINIITTEDAAVNETQIQGQVMSVEAVTARAEVAATRTAAPVNAANVVEQIMNQVKVQTSGGQFTEMRITLKPESLGDIILRVVTQNGIVMAQFEAENQRVKEALEADMNQLRDALEEAGIRFSELSVSVGHDEKERMNQFNKARQESRHRANSIEEAEEQPEISLHNGLIDVVG